MKNKLLIIALVLPTLILALWTAQLTYLRTAAPEYVVKITGFDPRDLLMGQHIVFQYDWASANPPIEPAPDTKTGRYYLPEHVAPKIEKQLISGKHDFSVRIHFQGQTPHIRDLLIDGQPWDTFTQE